MKRLLLSIPILVLFAVSAGAVTLQWPASTNPPTVVNSTVSFSSTTVTTISSPGIFEVTLSTMNATYYYRLDSVSTNVTAVGMPVFNGTAATIWGLNEINFQLGAGASPQVIPVIKVTPK